MHVATRFNTLIFLALIVFLIGCGPEKPLPTRAALAPSLAPAPTQIAQSATPIILGGQSAETPGQSANSTFDAVPTATPAQFVPTMTAPPSPTATPEPAGPTATPIMLNEVLVVDVVVLTDEAGANIREIYARGQDQGRDPNAFSRLGASIIATHHFLGRWDTGPYDLGPFAHLQPVIDQYQGSFSRVGEAAKRGLTALAVFDPLWSSEEACLANESVIDCEIRLHNPSILIIALGTNDKWDAVGFDQNLRMVVEHTIDQGVIPVLATKADRFEGEDNRNNESVRQIAADYQVPLWDFDLIADTLPGRGMGSDDVHLTLFDYYDYNMEAAYETGYGLYNLTALMMLDEIWRQLPEQAVQSSSP
jgi:hypothetical protein